jgi:6-phosphogluconolactonase
LASGVEPPECLRDRLSRRAAFIGVLAAASCLFGAGIATAATAPVFTEVTGSPFVTGNGPEAVAFSPNGGLLVSANSGAGDNLSVFSVASGGALSELPGSPVATGSDPVAVAFSPNGQLLADANEGDDTLSMFSVSPTGTLTQIGSPVATGSDPIAVTFSPSGGLLAAGNDNDDTVSMFAVSPAGGLTEVAGSPFATGSDPVSVAFSSDGGLLASANDNDNTVSMFAVSATGQLTEVLPGSPFATGNDPVTVAFSPAGGLLTTANPADSTMSMFSVSPGGALSEVAGSPFATGNSPDWAAFSPDGRLLATANQGDSTSSVFSVSPSGALSEVAGSPYATGGAPDALAISPRGVIAIANQADSTLSIFSVEPPAAAINSPADGGTYRLNQPVATSFSCTDATDAPGISACTDANGAAAGSGLLSTKTAGVYGYTVTAVSSDGQTATTAVKYTVLTASGALPPTANACPRATGRLHGATLGRVALGMTRVQARRRYEQSSRHSSRFEDVFCLTPTSVSVGYASKQLLAPLSSSARGKLRGRVVVAISADPIYALRGIRPGATLRAATKRLHPGAVIHLGASNWYFAREGSTTGILEAHRGVVVDVGIANAQLTGNRKAQLRFIKRAF